MWCNLTFSMFVIGYLLYVAHRIVRQAQLSFFRLFFSKSRLLDKEWGFSSKEPTWANLGATPILHGTTRPTSAWSLGRVSCGAPELRKRQALAVEVKWLVAWAWAPQSLLNKCRSEASVVLAIGSVQKKMERGLSGRTTRSMLVPARSNINKSTKTFLWQDSSKKTCDPRASVGFRSAVVLKYFVLVYPSKKRQLVCEYIYIAGKSAFDMPHCHSN